jgi:hypothetical protein
MKKPSYKIYPTLLDSYNRYLIGPQYMSDDGPTEEEIDAKSLEELINKINRVPYLPTEPQARGTSFESCVNALLDSTDIEIKADKKDNRLYSFEGFEFPKELTDKVVRELTGYSTRSERISALISTPAGYVELYGVMDYSFPSVQVDLKTTKKYDFLKYKDNTQHKTYPFIAKENGIHVDNFCYLVTDFKDVYAEHYTYSPAFRDELIENICRFIDFIEINREIITDKKIFALDE